MKSIFDVTTKIGTKLKLKKNLKCAKFTIGTKPMCDKPIIGEKTLIVTQLKLWKNLMVTTQIETKTKLWLNSL